MITKILSIFIVCLFICSSVFEAQELISSSNSIKSSSSFTLLAQSHCNDCSDESCSDIGGCCQSFCACASSFFISSKYSFSYVSSPLISKAEWYFHSSYNSPILDPSIKPPLFS